jgi:hypothetical protein
VAENILENPRIGAGQYAISNDGSLIYIPGGVTYGEHELVFVDKAGNARSLTATKRPYEDFTISPDGRFIATTIEGPVTDTWVHDIARDTETRFTSGVENRDPTWTPDGKHIAYGGYKNGKYRVFWKPIDGGPEETLLASDNAVYAWFFSRDGRALLYAEFGGSAGQNVGILPLDDRDHPRPVIPAAIQRGVGHPLAGRPVDCLQRRRVGKVRSVRRPVSEPRATGANFHGRGHAPAVVARRPRALLPRRGEPGGTRASCPGAAYSSDGRPD